MLGLLHSLWRAFKMNRAMQEPSAGEVCVACEGRDLTIVGVSAYRCNACGYEGGDGWAALERQRREASFRQMSPQRRRESACQDLLKARTLLTSGIGDLERARGLSGLDLAGWAGGSGPEFRDQDEHKHQALTSGIGLLLEAKQKAQDAQAKLGISLGIAATAEGGGTSNTRAAWDLHLDNLFADWMVHRDIKRTLGEAHRMQAAVDETLAREFQR